LNEFFGPGTILTNENLPYVNASQNFPGGAWGWMKPSEVPATGRGTVYIDRGTFRGLSGTDFQMVGTYLHETANILAVQRFTHEPTKFNRALLGPRGALPSPGQANHPWDRDIGQQFEECIRRKK